MSITGGYFKNQILPPEWNLKQFSRGCWSPDSHDVILQSFFYWYLLFGLVSKCLELTPDTPCQLKCSQLSQTLKRQDWGGRYLQIIALFFLSRDETRLTRQPFPPLPKAAHCPNPFPLPHTPTTLNAPLLSLHYHSHRLQLGADENRASNCNGEESVRRSSVGARGGTELELRCECLVAWAPARSARGAPVHTSLLGSDRYLAGTLSQPTAIASHLPPCFLHWTGHWGRLPVFVSSPAPSCVIFGEEKTFWAGHLLCTCSCPCVPPHTLPITLTQWHIRPHIFHQNFHFICLLKVLYVCWSHAVASATICNNQRLPLALQSNCLESQNEYCAHVPPTQRWLHFWSKSGAGIGKIHGNNVATILQLKT